MSRPSVIAVVAVVEVHIRNPAVAATRTVEVVTVAGELWTRAEGQDDAAAVIAPAAPGHIVISAS